MPNKFQVKRTTITGRTPNTTSSGNGSFIDAGELALNLTDGKMFSSNGSVYFEVGANLQNLNVTANITAASIDIGAGGFTANSSAVAIADPLTANGATGTSGQALLSNGATGSPYWATITTPATYVQNTDSRTLSGNLVISGTSFTPSSNTVLLGNTDQRWVISANTIDASGLIAMTSYRETANTPTISAGSLTLNLSLASVFTVALNGNVTSLTISNPASSGNVSSFTLVFTADGTARSVTWPASVKWPAGTAPTLTSTNGKKDVFTFFTTDGGTTYNAFVSGQNL